MEVMMNKRFNALIFFSLICSIDSVALYGNMVTQFRTPVSLSELLHEGLVQVQHEIEQVDMARVDQAQIVLISSMEKIEHLQNLYEERSTKSGLNEVHSQERDFLQSLIDRIDQMIQTLEGDASDENNQLIKKNIVLLQALRTTLDD